MSFYELSLIVRPYERTLLVPVLKRVANGLMDHGGLLKKIEYLGTRSLPFRIKSHGEKHVAGCYFLMQGYMPPKAIAEMNDALKRDVDIIRCNFYHKRQTLTRPCETGPCLWGEVTNEVHEKLRGIRLNQKV